MILLFTDFGLTGPYIGQLKAVLHCHAPGVPVIDLFADAPRFNIRASAHLLASYAVALPPGSVFLAVVDPGVGSAQRLPVMLQCDDRWYVGPDNGLFDALMQRSTRCEKHKIVWRPANLSNSFHGRDLFAPVAAMLATGKMPESEPVETRPASDEIAAGDLAEIIYIDHFGNLITGIRASSVALHCTLQYKGTTIPRVRTFADVATGEPLCYENSNGLLEVAVNQGSAAEYFKARVGEGLEPLSG